MFRLYVYSCGFSLDPTEWNRASSILIGGTIDLKESEQTAQLLFVKQLDDGLLVLRCYESFDKKRRQPILVPPFDVKFIKTTEFAIRYHPSLQTVEEIDEDEDEDEGE